MNLFSNLDTWSDEHHPRLLDLIRVLLGLVILFKGIYFISHTDELQSILSNSKFPWVSFIIAHYVALAHLAGGLLIAVEEGSAEKIKQILLEEEIEFIKPIGRFIKLEEKVIRIN